MPRVIVANHRSYNEGILMHRNSGFVWIAAALVLASAPCLAEQRPVVVQPNKPVLILPSAGSQKKTTDSNQKIELKKDTSEKTDKTGGSSKLEMSKEESKAKQKQLKQQEEQQALASGCTSKGQLSASECQQVAKACAAEANPQSCMGWKENEQINADKKAAEQQHIQQGLETGCVGKGGLSASECQQAAKTCAAGPNPDGCMVGEENKLINADKKAAEQQQMQQSLEATCVSKGINASECQQAAKTCAAGLGPTECMVGEMIKLTIAAQKAVEAKAEALRAAARRLNEKKSQ